MVRGSLFVVGTGGEAVKFGWDSVCSGDSLGHSVGVRQGGEQDGHVCLSNGGHLELSWAVRRRRDGRVVVWASKPAPGGLRRGREAGKKRG